ncbi:MAG: DUF2780 domain-containing protein [Methylobacter sp.]|nr:DUF2780 domain-containing protein [Methylobacter sp.]
MHNTKIITFCMSMTVSLVSINNADAAGWQDLLNAVGNKTNSQANNPAPLTPPVQQLVAGSLPELLMQKTGVSGAQAQSGAGALFQIAKNKMSADSFTQLEQSVPGMQGMLGAATPALAQPSGLAGTLSSLAGGASGGTAGSLLSVASAFQQQGMSPTMIQQFIPVVIDYVKAHGNDALVNSLSSALIGH